MTITRTFGEPAAFDLRVRRLVRAKLPESTRAVLAPLFPVGMPGGYVAIALLAARSLHRRRRRGGPAIVGAATLGWFSQWAVKRVVTRARPRQPRTIGRVESFPSGHTTGTTATAVTMAYVLRHQRVIDERSALLLGVGAPVVMGVYRVIDDEHWATDVIAGWLLGAGIAGVCVALFSRSVRAAR